MKNTSLTRAGISRLANQIFEEAGGKERLLQRMKNYCDVSLTSEHIHNYFYVSRDVFDYSDINATLGQAAVFLHGAEDAQTAGRNFTEILLCLAEYKYLIEYTFCDKAFDGYAYQIILHAWMQFREDASFSEVCTNSEKILIEDWFYERAKLMYRDRDGDTWATFRPYDNQEIGVGACAVLSEFLKERDPEIAKTLIAVADDRLIGWEQKNGNLDDTLFYTPVFSMTLYYYSYYRPRMDLLTLPNCRETFEGLLQQQSGTGIFTQYNWTQTGSAASMMALGAHLFHDGRYKWMAEQFIFERTKKRNQRMQYAARELSLENLKTHRTGDQGIELQDVISEELRRKDRYDHVWEGLTDNIFHLWFFWDDELLSVPPSQGSMVWEKSAGQGRWPFDPEPVLADKLVLREGWGEKDLFTLLSVWGGQNTPSERTVSHRYPASGEIISLVCGEQFLVQNIDQISRDIQINRADLNAFSILRDGEWLSAPKVTFNPEGRTFGIYPALDMPNAELRFFETLPAVDATKLSLYEFHGWTSERTALLLKGAGLIVFDQSFGATEETGGTRWHLQGEIVAETKESLRLRLFDSEMNVLYPHNPEWLSVQKTPNKRAVAVYQHHADWDLDLVSKGKRMGAVTIFAPERGKNVTAKVADVRCSTHPAHPDAMGVWFDGALIGTRLGLYRDEYAYDGFKTDAGAFVFRPNEFGCTISLIDGRLIRMNAPTLSRIDNLPEGCSVEHRNGVLALRFKKSVSGEIVIRY